MNKTKPILVSKLESLFKSYIELKRSLGFKYESEYKTFKYFTKYCKSNYDTSIDEFCIDSWIKQLKNTTLKTCSNHVGAMRGWAKYLYAKGYMQLYIPNVRCPHSTPFTPHYYTDEEIHKIWNVIDNIKEYKHQENLNKCIPVLFRLLYACGLRITEALSITKNDIDFSKNVILLKETKYSKERYIPMSNSISKILYNYVSNLKVNNDRPIFFYNKDKKLSKNSIYSRFRTILKDAHISHKGKLYGPRVHDFRHTFSINAMNKLCDEGNDLYVALPILSAYLGHSSIRATEKYIRLTKERMGIVVNDMNNLTAKIFPEVKQNEEI